MDSLIDIAVNKVFTIYQNPRSRDFIDLYFILKKRGWNIKDLVKKAQVKFDHHINYLQLGAQFMKCLEFKDYPRMIVKIAENEWQDFFIEQAKSFEGEVMD